MEENNTNTQNQENISADIKKVKTEKITTKLISLDWIQSSKGIPILRARVKEGNLHTKSTTESYIAALDGEAGAIKYVKDKLDAGEVGILSGALISWERTTYPANFPHERNGESVILDTEDVIDHITCVNLQPIADCLLNKYLEENQQTRCDLQYTLLMRSFGVLLNSNVK